MFELCVIVLRKLNTGMNVFLQQCHLIRVVTVQSDP